MKTRVKPGDLAYLVHSHFPENNGLVVEVIEMDGWWTATTQKVYWVVKTRHEVSGIAMDGSIKTNTCHVAADGALRPINGGILDEDEKIEHPKREKIE